MGGVAADGEIKWDVEGQDVGTHAEEASGEAGEGHGAIGGEEEGRRDDGFGGEAGFVEEEEEEGEDGEGEGESQEGRVGGCGGKGRGGGRGGVMVEGPQQDAQAESQECGADKIYAFDAVPEQ